MSYRLAADAALAVHFAFIAFVVLGAMLAWRWRWIAIFHIPAAIWGAYVELAGVVCPLTYLENDLRVRAGDAGYRDGFVAHYLLAVIYPAGLTREAQFVLAGFVVAVNLALYGWLLRRSRRSGPHEDRHAARGGPRP